MVARGAMELPFSDSIRNEPVFVELVAELEG